MTHYFDIRRMIPRLLVVPVQLLALVTSPVFQTKRARANVQQRNVKMSTMPKMAIPEWLSKTSALHK